jgi:hypothetical protein
MALPAVDACSRTYSLMPCDGWITIRTQTEMFLKWKYIDSERPLVLAWVADEQRCWRGVPDPCVTLKSMPS